MRRLPLLAAVLAATLPVAAMAKDTVKIATFILGGPVARHAKEGSFGVLVYSETSRDDKKRVSDHCPVSIEIR
ncbi:hypothetical protein [Niveispirillum fermenti]|uniref:hypothetical protein n=1 Tax=Niveispirillum fermenti TaxID=1233113 RepID=UPI003A878722